jgi:DNA-binding CsgD family transcriptional regulator
MAQRSSEQPRCAPMSADRISNLTEAQREVLRRFHIRRSAKEIGRELGITHWAVNERLRAARRVLGVATSGEAARLLAEAEAGRPYNQVVCDPEPIAGTAEHVLFSGSGEDGEYRPPVYRTTAVREEQAPYLALVAPGLRLPLPRFRGDRNDLTIRTRLMWIGALAFGLVAILGALITISSGVVRMVSQILRHLA